MANSSEVKMMDITLPLVKRLVINSGAPDPVGDAQRQINNMCGVNDEDFLKYNGSEARSNNAGADGSPHQKMFEDLKLLSTVDPQQRKINQLCGVSDEEFIACQNKMDHQYDPSIDATQRKINEMMGVSDETFLKYGGKKEEKR